MLDHRSQAPVRAPERVDITRLMNEHGQRIVLAPVVAKRRAANRTARKSRKRNR